MIFTKNKFDAQQKLEELAGEGCVHKITALRILLAIHELNHELEGADVCAPLHVMDVREKLRTDTKQNLPTYWFAKSLEILYGSLLVAAPANNRLSITSNGSEVVRVLFLHKNTHLRKTVQPSCLRTKFLQDTELHFARVAS